MPETMLAVTFSAWLARTAAHRLKLDARHVRKIAAAVGVTIWIEQV